jgi:hypothetical protein
VRAKATCALAIAVTALACPSRAGAADGGAVGVEAGAGESQQGPAIPASVYEYQRVNGRVDFTEKTSLALTARLTHDFATAPDPTTMLRTGDDWVWLGTLDFTQDVGDHVELGASVSGSPPSGRDVASSSLVHTTNANAGGAVDFTYDTFTLDGPPHRADVAWNAAAGYTWLASDQTLAQPSAKGTASLSQIRLETSLTGTLAENTDLGLDLAYYLYSPSDPSNVGFFQSGTTTWGAGLPLLPARWTLRPELAQRIGPVSLRAYYQFADYALDGWSGHTVGGKAQVRLGTFRLYATGYFRWDDEAGTPATAWTAGVGLVKDL